MKNITVKSVKETQKLGDFLAMEILKSKSSKKAIILVLSGELGAGKTTFLQGFAKGLGIKEKINSPTFVIMKKFQIPNHKSQISSKPKTPNSKIIKKSDISYSLLSQETGYKWFYHIDCYRLNNPKEILDLGFEEIISNSENIVAIEWGELIKNILPKKIIKIKFKHSKLASTKGSHEVRDNVREILLKL